MGGIISLLFYVFIISCVVKNVKKKTRGNNVRNASYSKSTSYNQPVVHNYTPRNVRKSSMLDSGLEDRNHDWLAMQLAEERKAQREVSAMFQLKQSHYNNCAAQAARFEHMMNCDANGIDTGTPR